MPRLGPDAAYIFRITHARNVPWLLRHGIHCPSSDARDPEFVSIGSVELIERRASRAVPIDPGGSLADYVPFYFTPSSIMLYNIKTGFGGVQRRDNREIVILVSSLPHVRTVGCRFLFTNGHAYTADTEFFADLSDLHNIDWELLRSRDFKHDAEDPSKKSRYQAEALVHRHLPARGLLGIACYDEVVQRELRSEVDAAGLTLRTEVRPEWYF